MTALGSRPGGTARREAGAARRLDAEALELGGGLEVLLQAALAGMRPGEEVEVVTPSRAVAMELPGWARVEGHAAGEPSALARGDDGRAWAVRLRRGPGRRVLADDGPPVAGAVRLRPDGELHTADWRDAGPAPPAPADADRHGGLTPLGAIPEHGAPAFDWRLHERAQVWSEDVGELAEQASAQQWDASRDVPWAAARGLPEPLQRAVAQVMTFIAQNEYAALYVPAAFLPQVHPAYPEALMWLASHVHDEARHVEVFTKRALLAGERGRALASTELSLKTLLDEHDFTNAALLLNVLGEGTFLDLLRFVERHAPDAATAAAARLAHRDERRHVHFGISHVRQVLDADPEQRGTLISAAEQRAAKLTELSGLSPLLTEGLTIMAAGSLRPAALSEGAKAVRALMRTMEGNRIRRLIAAGFDRPTARRLSELHTPNLM
ncbi:MAG: sulfurtransferase TusA family protein [Conexibacter sp.]